MSSEIPRPEKTLVDSYLAGEIPDEVVHDAFELYVDYFHETDSSVPLLQLIGMTIGEYSEFARAPERLLEILQNRPTLLNRLKGILFDRKVTTAEGSSERINHLKDPYSAFSELTEIAKKERGSDSDELGRKACQVMLANADLPFMPVFLFAFYSASFTLADTETISFFLLNGLAQHDPDLINELFKSVEYVRGLLTRGHKIKDNQLKIGSLIVTITPQIIYKPEEIVSLLRLFLHKDPPPEAEVWAKALAAA